MVGVLPMKRIVLNAVFATLAVSIGCIIGWAFSLGTVFYYRKYNLYYNNYGV